MSDLTPFPSLLNLSEPMLYAPSFQIDKLADVLLFTLAVKPPIVLNASSEALILMFLFLNLRCHYPPVAYSQLSSMLIHDAWLYPPVPPVPARNNLV